MSTLRLLVCLEALLFLTGVSGEHYTTLPRIATGQNVDILLRQFENCPREEEGQRLFYYTIEKVKHISRKKVVFSGPMVAKLGISDDLEVIFNMASRSGGTWIENYFNTKPGGLCSKANMLLPKMWSRLLKNLGFDSCPVPPGSYMMNNLDLTPDFRFPVIPLNKYRVRLLMSKNRTRIGCAQVVVDVVEKKK